MKPRYRLVSTTRDYLLFRNINSSGPYATSYVIPRWRWILMSYGTWVGAL